MTTLEEQFALLIANTASQQILHIPDVIQQSAVQLSSRTRTVYSVGEAISQRGSNAKLGTGLNRDTSTRR